MEDLPPAPLGILQIPLDVLRLIPNIGSMKIPDILHLCQTNRRMNEVICNNRALWEALAYKRLTGVLDIVRKLPLPQIKRDLHDLDNFRNYDEHKRESIIRHFGEQGYSRVGPPPRLRDEYLEGAFYGGQTHIIQKYMKEIRASPTLPVYLGQAARGGHNNIVAFFLPKVTDSNLASVYYGAVEGGNQEVIDALHEKGIDDDIKGEALPYAVDGEQFNLIPDLLPFADEESIGEAIDHLVGLTPTDETKDALRQLLSADNADVNTGQINDAIPTDYLDILLEHVGTNDILEAAKDLDGTNEGLVALEHMLPHLNETQLADLFWFQAGKNNFRVVGHMLEKMAPIDIHDAFIQAIYREANNVVQLLYPSVSDADKAFLTRYSRRAGVQLL